MPGHLPDVVTGESGVTVIGAQHMRISGSGVAEVPSQGAFQRFTGLESTDDLAPTLFWSVPFTLIQEGDTLFKMVWNTFMINDTNDPGTFMGSSSSRRSTDCCCPTSAP